MFHSSEHGHGDVPTFYTCDEGLSALTQEGQATLERLEGMLAQSVAQQFHMAGVRTEENKADFEGLRRPRMMIIICQSFKLDFPCQCAVCVDRWDGGRRSINGTRSV